MNLLSSNLKQRPAWAEVANQLLHLPGGRWQETELENNDISLMVPCGSSYQVLRLLLASAVDVGKPGTMESIGGLYDLCRSDRSNASEAKIVYALESGTPGGSEGGKVEEEEGGKEHGLRGYMQLQLDLLSAQHPSLSSTPILPISHPSDLPSLLSSLQQQPPSPTPVSASAPAPIPTGAHPQHQPNNYYNPGDINYNTYIPTRDTLLPLCTAPSNNQRRFAPLSPYSVSVLSGPIFINFPGLRDLLELVETEEGREQIRNAMVRASGDGGELAELGRVEAERFLAFWEHEFAV